MSIRARVLVLPGIALATSFGAVLVGGGLLATGSRSEPSAPPTAPDTGTRSATPSATASTSPSAAHQDRSRLTLTIADPAAADPAPGLVTAGPGGPGSRRLCLTGMIAAAWAPEDPAGWTTDGPTPCRDNGTTAGPVTIVLVRR